MTISEDEVKKWLLSKKEDDFISFNLNQFRDEITFSIWLDELSEKAIKTINFNPTSGQDNLVLALYLRMYNSHKAIIREAILGFWTEAECIARPLFEALILLSESIRNPEFVNEYVLSQNKLIENMTKKYANDQKRPEPRLVQVPNLDISKILERIKVEGTGSWTLEGLAELNGLTMLHDQIYKMYHNSVHVKPNSINRHFETEDGRVKNIIVRPSPEHPEEMLNTVLLSKADGLRKFVGHFNIDQLENEINEMWSFICLHSSKRGKNNQKKD